MSLPISMGRLATVWLIMAVAMSANGVTDTTPFVWVRWMRRG